MATMVREQIEGAREIELLAKQVGTDEHGFTRVFISFPCQDGGCNEGEHCFVFDGSKLLRLLKQEMGLSDLEKDVDWDYQLRLLLGE
ncbi:hypothetical protein [Microbacterium panaciterrae]|uniref:Uncharacterized protein n=1 Tax=Microbacterium panaciterrae TaxID=985759 RepID=A0ABP8P4B5_9MICO